MDISDGTIRSQEEIEAMSKELRAMFRPFEADLMTKKQEMEKKVSTMDHRSPLGQMFTHARKVGRNEPCPCGSGKKFKWCHWNV